MKSTGVVRKVDDLGRIVIPIELRNRFGIELKDPVEVFVEGSNIIIKKYEENCMFCGNIENLTNYKGKLICTKCIGEIKSN